MSAFVSNFGPCIPMYNGTDSIIPKGTCVSIDTTGDFYMKPTPLDNAYTCQGITANQVQIGAWGQVIQAGMAEMLLEDGGGAGRGEWIKPSVTTAGRIEVQGQPGESFSATALNTGTLVDGTTSKGSIFSGTVANLVNTNNVYLVLAEASGTPGMNLTITFDNVSVVPNVLTVTGYTPSDHVNGVVIKIWDYVNSAWVTAVTVAALTTTTRVYPFTGITADMVSSQTMKVLISHPDQGNASHRFYLDSLVFNATDDHEHFKELGHILENKTAGTDVLVWGSIHLL